MSLSLPQKILLLYPDITRRNGNQVPIINFITGEPGGVVLKFDESGNQYIDSWTNPDFPEPTTEQLDDSNFE